MLKKYLQKAKELAGNMDKTYLYFLAIDLREIENHNINAGVYEPFIEFNLQRGLYEKDPFCKNRLTINEVNAIMEMGDFDYYDKDKLFCYKKHFDPFNPDEVREIIEKMKAEGILVKKEKERLMCF